MTREEAISWLTNEKWKNANNQYKKEWNEAFDMAIEALSAPQTDIISRADALEEMAQAECGLHYADCEADNCSCAYTTRILNIPSAEAVHGWRIGKPTEQGKYMVTVDSMRHGMVELMYYGKPLMPNRKVKGMCWYRSDDEWGDVVYDDTDILAWMPLPKPYKGDDDE